jgi:hypothetical protein
MKAVLIYDIQDNEKIYRFDVFNKKTDKTCERINVYATSPLDAREIVRDCIHIIHPECTNPDSGFDFRVYTGDGTRHKINSKFVECSDYTQVYDLRDLMDEYSDGDFMYELESITLDKVEIFESDVDPDNHYTVPVCKKFETVSAWDSNLNIKSHIVMCKTILQPNEDEETDVHAILNIIIDPFKLTLKFDPSEYPHTVTKFSLTGIYIKRNYICGKSTN